MKDSEKNEFATKGYVEYIIEQLNKERNRFHLFTYVTLGLAILFSAALQCDNNKKLERRISALEESLTPITANILEGKEPEKYTIINGDTFYLEIDGKSIDEYFEENQNPKLLQE